MALDRYTELFLEEAGEQVEDLNQNLLALEREGFSRPIIDEIFRVAHTFKSAAAFVGLESLARLAHHMEDLLQRIKDGALQPGDDVAQVLFACLDRISGAIQVVAEGEKPSEDNADLIARLEAVMQSSDSTGTVESQAPAAIAQSVAASPPVPPALAAQPATGAAPGPGTAQAVADPVAAPSASGSNYELSADEERELLQVAAGRTVYEGLVRIDEDAPMPHIRFVLLLENLKKVAEVFRTSPSDEELQSGAAVSELAFVLISNAERESLLKTCEVDMVESVVLGVRSTETKTGMRASDRGEESRLTSKNIKVSAGKIDFLMNNVGEMVIINSGLQKIYDDLSGDHGDSPSLADLRSRIDGASRIARDLQNGIMKMRMIAVGLVFHRFTRPVRDLSRDLGKQVDLQFTGEDTELDKNIIDALNEPLLHLVRNSVDHGVETPAERLQVGKSETASVSLNAYQGGNSIFIEVRDDGRGLNRERILARAEERGLVTANNRPTADEEIFDLIFQPGFSTAKEVSDVSGRGVGMNVVRSMIQKFNGTIRIENEPGQSCAFILSFPLTLAIISGILVRSGGEEYAFPLSEVVENIKIARDDVTRLEGRDIFNLRGEILPVLRLDGCLGLPVEELPEQFPIVIVQNADRKYGFVVDGLIGKKEIVIKSLDTNFRSVRGLIGACLMGDGRIVMVLDVQGLLEIAQRESHEPDTALLSAVHGYNDAVAALTEQSKLYARSGKRASARSRDEDPTEGGPVSALPVHVEKIAAGEEVAGLLPNDLLADDPGPPDLASDPSKPQSVDDQLFAEVARAIGSPQPSSTGKNGPDSEFSAALSQAVDRDPGRTPDREVPRVTEPPPAENPGTPVPAAAEQTASGPDELYPRLYELIGKGMSNAGMVLSQLLGASIEVAVPESRVVAAQDFSDYLPSEDIISVWLDGEGEISPTLLLVFDESMGLKASGDLMGLPREQWTADQIPREDIQSVLSELTNIVGSSILNEFANRTSLQVMPAVPSFHYGPGNTLQERFDELNRAHDVEIIYVSTDFYRDQMDLVGRLFVFLPHASIARIMEKLK